VISRWFEGSCEITSYDLDELLGTKLRALYQRKAGRDLFDLAVALSSGKVIPERIVEAFLRHMAHGGAAVSRALFEKNLAAKMKDADFLADIGPLLSDGYHWDPATEAQLVSSTLIKRLPGEPWKGGA
jgi:predicted nucleotidyltransferase component of viral defense system